MWSVWSETVDLYVGPSGALVKVGKSDAVEIAHSGDTPADRWLERLFEDIASANLLSATRSNRFRISLSGAYCPAVVYSLPAQVTRWAEICEIASATAAATVGTSPDQLVCEVETSGRGLAGAVSTLVLRQFHDWAKLNRCTIVSIQPLWANAAQSRIATRSVAVGLLVQDPDATTVLVEQIDGRLAAATVIGNAVEAEFQAKIRRLLVSQGGGAGEMVRLGFGVQKRTPLQGGPHRMADHWYEL